ncbi:MAG: peptide deformylase [Gammaproteobacteria bacterium]
MCELNNQGVTSILPKSQNQPPSMAILQILQYPDPRLRNVAVPLRTVNYEIKRLVDDLFETMYDAPGIGLAATQVNVHKRIIVADVSDSRDAPVCLINPTIVQAVGSEHMEEGCLSVPSVYENVERAQAITVRGLDRNGDPRELELEELLGVCVQHEIDHLDGKLFVDYLSHLKRTRIRKKLEKAQKQL